MAAVPEYLPLPPVDDSPIIYREKRLKTGLVKNLNTNYQFILQNVDFSLFSKSLIVIKTSNVDVPITVTISRCAYDTSGVAATDAARFVPIPGGSAVLPLSPGGSSYQDFSIAQMVAEFVMIEFLASGATTGLLSEVLIVGKKY